MSTSNGTNGKGFDMASRKGAAAAREDAGTVVHVRDEVGEFLHYGEDDAKKPVTITVAGTYSSVYRKAMAAQRDKSLRLRRRQLTADEVDRRALEVIAACILSWDGFFENGRPYQLTPENAAILLESAPWIRDDVEAAMGDHESFFKNVSPS